ncbi:hypothetical protein Alches_11660 [Alicyclobacillus hesperidum subsp. aegles]|uniref:hypothetical protein n=1 Tax=Alicyclobacillus hesperidum TaxID=89784 RepID=UPI00071924ED|nr:hypothetical protein [Alicyclobacillus hesperidum]KRW92432.1 hypothetical protein SD51_02660 [Alicyclobacillus tengchongensis]GLG01127.1 hypothetical protein Alches_11660 [Alicyclobacillus hesperidum subsp. aegles]
MAKSRVNQRKTKDDRGARGHFRAMARELGLTESEFQRLAVALTKTLKGAALVGEAPVSARDLLAMLESPIVQSLFAAMISSVLKNTTSTDPSTAPVETAPKELPRPQPPAPWPGPFVQTPMPPHVHTQPSRQPRGPRPEMPNWYNTPPTSPPVAPVQPTPTPAAAPARFARQSGAREYRRAR